jgi:hypothetical protein
MLNLTYGYSERPNSYNMISTCWSLHVVLALLLFYTYSSGDMLEILCHFHDRGLKCFSALNSLSPGHFVYIMPQCLDISDTHS